MVNLALYPSELAAISVESEVLALEIFLAGVVTLELYMLSQYLRAFPFQPQWGTVGIKPVTVFTALVAVFSFPKYLARRC